MEDSLKVRLCGPFCPPESAHYQYFTQSVREHRNFRPSDDLIRRMDEEQAAFDAGEKDWVRRG